MEPEYFKLVNRIAMPCTMEEALEFYGEDKKRVRETEIGPATVSTIFMPLNHNFGGGDPILFETMIYLRGDVDADFWEGMSEYLNYQERCSTWAEAEEMHDEAVAMMTSWLAASEAEVDAALNRTPKVSNDGEKE